MLYSHKCAKGQGIGPSSAMIYHVLWVYHSSILPCLAKFSPPVGLWSLSATVCPTHVETYTAVEHKLHIRLRVLHAMLSHSAWMAFWTSFVCEAVLF